MSDKISKIPTKKNTHERQNLTKKWLMLCYFNYLIIYRYFYF